MGVCDKPLAVGLIKQLALALPLSFAQTQIHQSRTHFIPTHTSKCQRFPVPQWWPGTLNLIWFINYSRDCSHGLVYSTQGIAEIYHPSAIFAFAAWSGRLSSAVLLGGIWVMYFSYFIPSWRNGLYYATHTAVQTILQQITAWHFTLLCSLINIL